MSNVQRFSMALAPYTDDYEMRPDPDGDYVRSEDYAALAARLAEAEALLRYVCSLHPDDCSCSGCKFAFLAPDSATHRENDSHE